MTRHDQQILFAALGFVAVLLKEKSENQPNMSGRAITLAGLIEKFCAVSVPVPLADAATNLAEETSAAVIDLAIEKHVKELREKHETILPDDKESLIRLYQRLQIRKIYRIDAASFESANTDKLADHVLAHLDEEIAYRESMS